MGKLWNWLTGKKHEKEEELSSEWNEYPPGRWPNETPKIEYPLVDAPPIEFIDPSETPYSEELVPVRAKPAKAKKTKAKPKTKAKKSVKRKT